MAALPAFQLNCCECAAPQRRTALPLEMSRYGAALQQQPLTKPMDYYVDDPSCKKNQLEYSVHSVKESSWLFCTMLSIIPDPTTSWRPLQALRLVCLLQNGSMCVQMHIVDTLHYAL